MPVMHQNSHGQRVLKQISVPTLQNKYTTTRTTTESQITSRSANSYHSAICKQTIPFFIKVAMHCYEIDRINTSVLLHFLPQFVQCYILIINTHTWKHFFPCAIFSQATLHSYHGLATASRTNNKKGIALPWQHKALQKTRQFSVYTSHTPTLMNSTVSTGIALFFHNTCTECCLASLSSCMQNNCDRMLL